MDVDFAKSVDVSFTTARFLSPCVDPDTIYYKVPVVCGIIILTRAQQLLIEIGDRLATADMGQKWEGAAVPLFLGGGRAGSPSNTMSPGTRPTSVPSGILIHPAVWPQKTLERQKKIGGVVPPFLGGGELVFHLTQSRLGRGLPPYQVAS